MKRNFHIYLFLIFLLFVNGCNPRKRNVFDTHLKPLNSNFSLKATAHHEKGLFIIIPGAYYVFEAINKKDDSKINILEFRHDDPIEIPKENIIIKNEQLVYFWIGNKLGVTTNGGKTWHTWNSSNLKNISFNYGLIEKVEIDTKGFGKMFFNDLGIRENKIEYLTTNDFGKTWQKP